MATSARVLRRSLLRSPSDFSKYITKFVVSTPRRAPLAEQLSSAYDAYLEVIRAADSLAHAAMGRNAAWYIRNLMKSLVAGRDWR
ncbi:hypothetical protein C8R46DRAFT_1212259 [Mycena filopes]|nr:hypothetical protein C8R46DRAFT_1212259 [Mycena filopes]